MSIGSVSSTAPSQAPASTTPSAHAAKTGKGHHAHKGTGAPQSAPNLQNTNAVSSSTTTTGLKITA